MSGKRKRELRDDDEGLRTPTRKRPKAKDSKKSSKSKSKSKSSTSKSVKDSGTSKRKSGAHAARKSGAHAARKSGAHAARDPGTNASERKKKGALIPLLAGLLVVGGAGAGLAALVLGGDPPEEKVPQRIAGASDKPDVPTERFNANAKQVGAATTDQGNSPTPSEGPKELQPVASQQPTPGEQPTATPKANPLDELRTRSPDHENVARILDEFADLFSFDGLSQNPMFDEFQARRQREEELIARLRALGPYAVEALKDMVLGLNNRAHQIFLAKGMAGIPGPEAVAAVRDMLGQTNDVALQTTLVRFLPEGDDAAGLVRDAFSEQTNPTARTMLLREYSRRTMDDDQADTTVLREAALGDSNANVRSEAISILGRRGNPEDAALMERIVREEKNLQLRQRAVVAYGETGGQGTLDTLEGFMRDPNTPVRLKASTVLAISRVGGDRAISSLDLIAQSDPSQDIRTRAQKLANSLRARRDNPAPDIVDEEPLILGPGKPVR